MTSWGRERVERPVKKHADCFILMGHRPKQLGLPALHHYNEHLNEKWISSWYKTVLKFNICINFFLRDLFVQLDHLECSQTSAALLCFHWNHFDCLVWQCFILSSCCLRGLQASLLWLSLSIVILISSASYPCVTPSCVTVQSCIYSLFHGHVSSNKHATSAYTFNLNA